jgi:hypothetical protein
VPTTLDDVCLLRTGNPAHTSWFTRSHMSAGFEGEEGRRWSTLGTLPTTR